MWDCVWEGVWTAKNCAHTENSINFVFHSTRAVRDSTFINPRARSSCVANPSTRVPRGWDFALTNTHALRAKRRAVPSGRRNSLTVSVMTALWTCEEGVGELDGGGWW